MHSISKFALLACIGIACSLIIASPDNNPRPQHETEKAVAMRLDPAINLLQLDRMINTGDGLAALLVGLGLSVSSENALAAWVCYGAFIYNALRAFQRSFAIQDLEEIKKIVGNHCNRDVTFVIKATQA